MTNQVELVRKTLFDKLSEDFITCNTTHENPPPHHDCGEECAVSLEDQIAAANPFWSPVRSGGKKHKRCVDCWEEYINGLVDFILSIPELKILAPDQDTLKGEDNEKRIDTL